MKNLLFILLLCPLLSLGQDNAEATNTNNHKQTKKSFRRFEVAAYGGKAFYGYANNTYIQRGMFYDGAWITPDAHGATFRFTATAAFNVTRHWNAGILYAQNNLTYQAYIPWDHINEKIRYAKPLINYGVFSNYYFHIHRFQPFWGLSAAALTAKQVPEGYLIDEGKKTVTGWALGINAGLRYKLTKQIGISITEQINDENGGEYLWLITYSTMAGLSFSF